MTLDLAAATEQLHREQTKFLRVIAHALRTPLQSLQGFAELLEPGMPPGQLELYLNFIKRDVVHLASVVDDLCLRHELQRGELVLFPAIVDVGLLLADLARTFESQLPDCLVTLDYDDGIPPVYADPERLLHVLRTLLRNAERCRTDPGQPAMLTICARYERDAQQVTFVVDDDGPRIGRNDAVMLFDAIPNLPAELGRPRLGIGLGLYVARELARKMGGELCLRHGVSTRQHGNSFELRVPAYQGQVGHA